MAGTKIDEKKHTFCITGRLQTSAFLFRLIFHGHSLASVSQPLLS